jgi:hypothetical protein
LTHLRHQAKELLTKKNAGDEQAVRRFEEAHPRFNLKSGVGECGKKMTLADAQLVIAREYGFASWPKLKQHVEELEEVEQRVKRLRSTFAAADETTREQLLQCVHTKERFKNYTPGAITLSEEDARLVVANAEGYALWGKFESYLDLAPEVKQVIQAVKTGNLKELETLLVAEPCAANPRWVGAHRRSGSIPNDSVPLFCASEAVFNGTNRNGNDYEIAQALIRAGADVEIERGLPLTGAVSYNAAGVVRALLEGGARVDSPDGKGAPLAYALYFGFTATAEQLARHGAQTDLRFAAGLGKLTGMESYFGAGGLIDPDHAGRLGDPYEDRFRCERTRENVLNQALFFACMNGKLKAADFLIRKGADVNAFVPGLDVDLTILHWLTTISQGKTANAEAIEEQRIPVVDYLLAQGASVEIRDPKFNSTPLGWADYNWRKQMSERMKRARPFE